MPPIKLLMNDDKFYGKAKPVGEKLTPGVYKSNMPPNPTTPAIRYRTEHAQAVARAEVTESINNPEPVEPETKKEIVKYENENLEGEDNVKEFSEQQKSLGKRFTEFLQGDIIDTSKEMKEVQKKREMGRISGIDEPLQNEVQVGEIPKVAAAKTGELVQQGFNMITNNLTQAALILAGLYLAGQFLQGVGQGNTRRRNYTKRTPAPKAE